RWCSARTASRTARATPAASPPGPCTRSTRKPTVCAMSPGGARWRARRRPGRNRPLSSGASSERAEKLPRLYGVLQGPVSEIRRCPLGEDRLQLSPRLGGPAFLDEDLGEADPHARVRRVEPEAGVEQRLRPVDVAAQQGGGLVVEL